MLSDVLIISGIVAWDALVVWVAWKLGMRLPKHLRFRGPKLPRRLINRDKVEKIERVYNDLW